MWFILIFCFPITLAAAVKIEWEQTLPLPEMQRPVSLTADAAGNAYLCAAMGIYRTYSWTDILLAKWNANGGSEWTAIYNGAGGLRDEPYSMITDATGNSYITGESVSQGGSTNLILLKYSASGQLVWAREVAAEAGGFATGRVLTFASDGQIVVAGSTFTSNADILVLRYTPEGDLVWRSTYDGPARVDDLPTSLLLDPHGNVYVAGVSTLKTNALPWPNDTAALAVKFKPGGALEGGSSLDLSAYEDTATGLYLAGSNSVYIVGYAAEFCYPGQWSVTCYNDLFLGEWGGSGAIQVLRREGRFSNRVNPYFDEFNLLLSNRGYLVGYSLDSVRQFPPGAKAIESLFSNTGVLLSTIAAPDDSLVLAGASSAKPMIARVSPMGSILWRSGLNSFTNRGMARLTLLMPDSSILSAGTLETNKDDIFLAKFREIPTEGEPKILSISAPEMVLATSNAVLRVEASGAGLLSYQWRVADRLLPGETGPSLFLAAPRSSESHAYNVVVSNSLGVVQSKSVYFSVRSWLRHHSATQNEFKFDVIVEEPTRSYNLFTQVDGGSWSYLRELRPFTNRVIELVVPATNKAAFFQLR